jgi:hypothetical protein
VRVIELSLALLAPLGAAFSLSEPKSGEGTSRQGGGGGVAGSPENSGSKRVRRLSRGRFIFSFQRREQPERVWVVQNVARLVAYSPSRDRFPRDAATVGNPPERMYHPRISQVLPPGYMCIQCKKSRGSRDLSLHSALSNSQNNARLISPKTICT